MTGRRPPGGTARLLAVCALLALAAAVVVLCVGFVDTGALALVIGVAGLVLSAVGLWWLLSMRGLLRALGALLALGAPVAVLVHYIRHDVWVWALCALLLYGVALVCGRAAMRAHGKSYVLRGTTGTPPQHPFLIMNPRSGGGKVARFGLVEKAERLGAKVHLLDTSGDDPTDVAALAREAVADGADLLGVAGGDGTQALVAGVAAEHGLPLLVISAGTRNHFAMDLGLDRTDPSHCLDALTDGEELRVDLGMVNGRPFVNTVSFGAYADIVQRPEYRDAKTETALALLPDLLGTEGRRLSARAGEKEYPAQQAVLVTNNPYATPDPLAAGLRPRLDRGKLGVIALCIEGAAQAAHLAVRGERARGVGFAAVRRVEVTAPEETIPVAVDGEALTFTTPVVCTVRRRALRVLVPRTRPGTVAPRSPLNWRWITALALGRTR
ncbi:diacylglycerol/lipid kinase family protein [Streptomyces sp. KLOTTS4A1]|uniref:diacylglycerol/lipid kinase family protein n=1 Tax=Streptomyces sp. KLOTTS4A1 TaxID=3390996 RepID=UPI0039F4F790